jgi:uncharacterized protein
MARFLAPEALSAATEDLSLLPFNLERTGTGLYLVSNMVGDFIRLTEDEVNKLVSISEYDPATASMKKPTRLI